MLLKPPFENLYLKFRGLSQGEGNLDIPATLHETFLDAPYDLTPHFALPSYWKNREHDHPRYARFCYALAHVYSASNILEVGTSAGGTTTGWAKALNEFLLKGKQVKLVCVDNDSYAEGVYPTITKRNISQVGLPLSAVEFKTGDSKDVLPTLRQTYANYFHLYLVDGDHTYEGALRDMVNGLPLMKRGGIIAVHDIDTGVTVAEATPDHPSPVYEAFMDFISKNKFKYYMFKFIRKHLGIIQVD